MKKTLVPAITIAGLLAAASSTFAADRTWNSATASGDFSNTANWVGGVAPVSNDRLRFQGDGVITSYTVNNNLAAGTTFGSGTNYAIEFGVAGSSTGNFTLTGNRFVLNAGIATYSPASGTRNHAISADITLSSGTQTFSMAGNANLSVSGVIDGSGSINKVASGALTLSGNNSFTGNLSVSAGTLNFSTVANSGVSSNLGAGSSIQLGASSGNGTMAMADATSAQSTDRTVQIGGNNASWTGGGIIANNTASASHTLTFTNTTFNTTQALPTSSRTLGLTGTNTGLNTIEGVIQDNNASSAVQVNKSGAGTWRLSGSNTYTGGTNVSAGTLLVNNTSGSGTGTGDVNVSSGAAIGGGGAIGGDLILANGALFAFDTTLTLTLDGTLTLDNSFGIASLRNLSGGALDWNLIADNTYVLLDGNVPVFSAANISNFGLANAFAISGSRSAYFANASGGGLALMVIPEPSLASLLLVGFAGLALVRRRQALRVSGI